MLKNIMTGEEVEDRIKKLVRLVKYYDYMLHIKGKTIIKDEIYDAMRKELETLEMQYPELILPDSPSLYIGTVSASCNKIIKRTVPMLSLKHTYNKSELEKFINNSFTIDNKIIMEPKIDGVAVSATYIDGYIDNLSLRGDGYNGEDITHFAPYIKNLPLFIETEIQNIDIRGEIIAPKNLIKKNNRNYVAGCLRRKDAKDFGLEIIAYKVIFNKEIDNNLGNDDNKTSNIDNNLGNDDNNLWNEMMTQEKCLEWLEKICRIPKFIILKKEDDCLEKIDRFLENDFDFFHDGIVLKLNNIRIGESLGITNRYPKNAIAYKFTEKSQVTKIKEIDWNINRQGILIPVCILHPIEINGSKITKVHAYNKRYLQSNNLGINSIINISRVGDVIPQIANIIESSGFEKLTKCPFCSSDLEENEINYICLNELCKERSFQNILYFFNKLKVDGMSNNIINNFLSKNIISITDIIEHLENKKWPENKNEFKVYEKWQQKKHSITFSELIIAIGIQNISDVYINNLKINKPEDLLNIQREIGQKSESFFDFINKNYYYILNLWNLIKTFN
jgi:DNA ligase (NAD+)